MLLDLLELLDALLLLFQLVRSCIEQNRCHRRAGLQSGPLRAT